MLSPWQVSSDHKAKAVFIGLSLVPSGNEAWEQSGDLTLSTCDAFRADCTGNGLQHRRGQDVLHDPGGMTSDWVPLMDTTGVRRKPGLRRPLLRWRAAGASCTSADSLSSTVNYLARPSQLPSRREDLSSFSRHLVTDARCHCGRIHPHRRVGEDAGDSVERVGGQRLPLI